MSLDRRKSYMGVVKEAVTEALKADDRLDRVQVREWILRASDVEELALLYRLTDEGWNRIDPHLETEETCALIRDYLLRCILEDPQDGPALTRYEAAGELEAWFDHLAGMSEDGGAILRASAAAVTQAFLAGDDAVRRAIEHGFLEHVLEQSGLRPLFEHWATDSRLEGAWRTALAWGQAHPDFMKGLRGELRDAGSPEE
jgi:hypothetical protein